MVLTGVGSIAYRRPEDGIYVVPTGCLKPSSDRLPEEISEAEYTDCYNALLKRTVSGSHMKHAVSERTSAPH